MKSVGSMGSSPHGRFKRRTVSCPPDGKIHEFMNFKLILGAILLVAALIFSVQNADAMDVMLLVRTFPFSLALVIFVAVAAGLIGGWAITSALRQHRKSEHETEPR